MRSLRRAAMLAVVVLVTALTFAQDGTTSSATPAGGASTPMATVVVGDVNALVENVAAMVAKIVPGMTAEKIKSQVSAMMGGPGLDGLKENGGMAVIVQDPVPVAFLEVKPEAAEQFVKTFQQRGEKAVYADGLLVGTMSKKVDPNTAKPLIPMVKSQLLTSGKRQGSLKVNLQVSQLLKKYDAQIKGGIASAIEQQQKTGAETGYTTATANMAEFQMRMFHAMLKRAEKMEITLTPAAAGLRIDALAYPIGGIKPGTAKLPDIQAMRKLVPARGGYRAVASFDYKRTMDSVADLFEEVSREMNRPAEDGKKLREFVGTWMTAVGNGLAYDMLLPDKPMMSGAMVAEVTDPNAALAALEKVPQQFKDSGLGELYREMGVSFDMQFKRNVRQESDLQVSQLVMKVGVLDATSSQAAFMKKMMGDGVMEIVPVDNYLIYALGGEPLNALIAGVKAKANPDSKPLNAEQVFGPGANVYVDYNIARVMELAQGMAPATENPMFKGMVESLKSSPPLSFAGKTEDNAYKMSALVPIEMAQSVVAGVKSQQASTTHPE